MNQLEIMRSLSVDASSKMILIVFDGLGDIPFKVNKTPLESANIPNLDMLASEGICGLSCPILPGITPGSGPAHVSLFGYDPFEWNIGRGVLEALGIGFNLSKNDIAARGNFCTIDLKTKNITDRRAGRISNAEAKRIVDKLRSIRIPNVEIFVEHVKEYRFALIIRGESLEDGLTETDPQKIGVPSIPVQPLRREAENSAMILNEWLERARSILLDEKQANSCNLRGIAKTPQIPQMPGIYKLKMAAIASYPMYRGIAKLVGMDILKTGENIQDQLITLKENWEKYDFFFFHIKKTDSNGEDGNFDGKQKVIEEADLIIPNIRALNPDTLVITADHSTPCELKSHSWHEVPTLLWSKYVIPDNVSQFNERQCMSGGLGHINHQNIMALMMAYSLRLAKYGA
jgi:2,3-bisphosphoglycerate-independent phosphoglycerate mutase